LLNEIKLGLGKCPKYCFIPRVLLFCILFGSSYLHGQNSERVEFYYAYDGSKYKGSFVIDYTIYYDGKTRKGFDVIDFRKIYDDKARINLRIRSLKWANNAHANNLKLVFPKDMSEPVDGVLSDNGTKEFKSGDVINLDFEVIQPTSKEISSILFANFVILKRSFDYENRSGDVEKQLRNGDITGLQIHLKPILIIPRSYDSVDEEQTQLMYEIYVEMIVIYLADYGIYDLSMQMAQKLADRQFQDVTNLFADKKYNISPSQSAGSSVDLGEEIDYDQEAYLEAKRQNTIGSYQQYLSDYPSGKFAKAARRKIVIKTPYKILENKLNPKVYQYHFEKGISKLAKPKVVLKNNGDGAIKYTWVSDDIVEINLPEERESEVVFDLYGKKANYALKHSFDALHAEFEYDESEQNLHIRNIKGGKPPYRVDIYLDGNEIGSQNVENTEESRITIPEEELTYDKGSLLIRLMDIRDESISFNTELLLKPVESFSTYKFSILSALALFCLCGLLHRKLSI